MWRAALPPVGALEGGGETEVVGAWWAAEPRY